MTSDRRRKSLKYNAMPPNLTKVQLFDQHNKETLQVVLCILCVFVLKMTRHSIVVVYDVHFMRVCCKDDKTQYSCGI